MNQKDLLIYHANCPDGFGAAYCFWKKFGDTIEYRALTHEDTIPEDTVGRNIWMADFCYKLDTIKDILSKAKRVIIIDHHITAMNDIGEFSHPNLVTYFDMNHSGAALSWMYLFPHKEIPTLIRYIEDRDINKWELPDAKSFLSVVDSNKKDFDIWDALAVEAESAIGFNSLVNSGKILLKFMSENSNSIKQHIFIMKIAGIDFPTINTSLPWRSYILNEIAEEQFGRAASYYFNGKEYIFSLRSLEGELFIDVSEIAKSFSGGGHKRAAGFAVASLDDLNN